MIGLLKQISREGFGSALLRVNVSVCPSCFSRKEAQPISGQLAFQVAHKVYRCDGTECHSSSVDIFTC